LLFSVLLRPALLPERVFSLTMILALAAMEAVKTLSGLLPGIKWPNDLYAGMRKLGGILTEFSMIHEEVDWVVLGLGLNVNRRPEELAAQATCVMEETGIRVSRNQLLVEIIKGFEAAYQKILLGDIEIFHRRWNEAVSSWGRRLK
jgi:BirA family transcriptional regulator, biotin operon repressor / biotin---[acetyl-CoA-carboxylase] ligase